jgi:hypothetical protein
MSKPDKATRKADQYKRQIQLLEFYLRGRIRQPNSIAEKQPAESSACEMAASELQTVLNQVIPQMREVQP